MEEHIDENTMSTEALSERLSEIRPWLVKSLKERKGAYRGFATAYAEADAISFGFGNIKQVISFIDSYYEHSDSHASREFHEFEATPEGLAITIVSILALMIVAGIGTFYADDENLNENVVKYCIVKFYPYLRDMLQAIKWGYKGIRSTLNVIFHFIGHHELILKLLFPIGLALAVLSVLNRLFLRWMRNSRKQVQSENRELSLRIFEKSCRINFKETLPEGEKLKPYVNSLIYVSKDDETSNEVYLVYEDDGNYISEKLELSEGDIKQLDTTLQIFQSENLCKKLSSNFIGSANQKLYFLKELPVNSKELLSSEQQQINLTQDYANSLIYLTNPDLPEHERLYIVDENGLAKLDGRSAAFTAKLQKERENKQTITILPRQIDALFEKYSNNNIIKNRSIGMTYEEWSAYKAECIRKINEQEEWSDYNYKGDKNKLSIKYTIIAAYLAVIFAATSDGMYFYMGPLFLAMFNPSLFITALAMSSVMLIICYLVRINQEYNYQRVLQRTQLNVKIALSQAECRMLNIDIEKGFKEGNLEGSSLKSKQDELLTELQNYDALQKKLEKNVIFSIYSAILQGFENGLSTQGVVSGIMFFVASTMMLSGASCPPVFIITMMAASLLILAATVAQYVVCYQMYIKKVEYHKDLYLQKYNEATNDKDRQDALLEIKNLLDERTIKEPTDLHITDYCEIPRVIISGNGKLIKNFNELMYGYTSQHGNPWWSILVFIPIAIFISVTFGVRTVKKMFTVPSDKSTTIKNNGIEEIPIKGRGSSWGLSFFNFREDDKSGSVNTSRGSPCKLQKGPPPGDAPRYSSITELSGNA
jgi:hypothetical protein